MEDGRHKMTAGIRAATLSDVPQMIGLLMQDARQRTALNPMLWPLATDAETQVREALQFALGDEAQPFRQKWIVAEIADRLVGIVHSMLLPVPPIYSGVWGDPGLLMPDAFVAADAPAGTVTALVEAAEADLREAGAQVLLAAYVAEDEWPACFARHGYTPLTLYLSKEDLGAGPVENSGDAASENDIPGIVAQSADHRSTLNDLNVFWAPHPDADTRFDRWMRRSLTLGDRDMLISRSTGGIDGYVIAQPASRLHFPPAHDISAIGVIDDYYHVDYADPARLQGDAPGASGLLRSAEAAFARRDITASFVVCPAAWRSKVDVLQNAGYQTAMVWMIKK